MTERITVGHIFSMVPGFTLILPCFNEEKAIPVVLPEAYRELSAIAQQAKIPFEILVVNDGSTDQSQYEIEKIQGVRWVSYSVNRGYGAAIKSGIAASKFDYVGVMDLDATCNPQNFSLLLTKLREQPELIMGVGNRLHSESEMPKVRRLGNRLYSYLIFLLKLRYIADPCSGLRVYKKSWLMNVFEQLPDQLNFTLATTMLALSKNLEFIEVKIDYSGRIGSSKLRELRDGILFLRTILKLSLIK